MAQIEVIGNVGKDPELKFISGAKGDFAVAKFSVADTPREQKNGEWVEGETTWYFVSVTGQLAEAVTDKVTKGSKVLVRGDLRSFEYKKDNETKSGWEIRAKFVAVIPTITKTKKAEVEEAWPF